MPKLVQHERLVGRWVGREMNDGLGVGNCWRQMVSPWESSYSSDFCISSRFSIIIKKKKLRLKKKKKLHPKATVGCGYDFQTKVLWGRF